MLGIDSTVAFGIDEDAFKTRDERRVAEQARKREHQVQTTHHLKQLVVKDERVDTHFENRALELVGRRRGLLAAPASNVVIPSALISGLKAQALRV